MKQYITLIITILILSVLFSCNKHSENPSITKSPCKLLMDSTSYGEKNVYSYDASNNLIKVIHSSTYSNYAYSFIYTNGKLSALIPLNYDNTPYLPGTNIIVTDTSGNVRKVIEPSGDSLTYDLDFTTIKDYLRKNWVRRSDKINTFKINGIRISLIYKYDGNGNATEAYDPNINWLNFKPIPSQTILNGINYITKSYSTRCVCNYDDHEKNVYSYT